MAAAASPPLSHLGPPDEHTPAGREVLTFQHNPAQSTYALRDKNGGLVSISTNARLHGIFVLSKEDTNGDGETESVLTCYRRNLFEVSGEVMLSTWPHSVSAANSQPGTITGLYATLGAVESRDWTPVAIVSNVSRVHSGSAPSPDGEPPHDYELILPTLGGVGSADQAQLNFSWERLQFRSATANNGRKRKSVRQKFRVDVSIYARTRDGRSIRLSTMTSSLVTVRGRSPKNFLARNDHPLDNNIIPQALRRSMIDPHVVNEPEAVALGSMVQTQLPVLSYGENTLDEALAVDQTLASPTMWDWIDLSIPSPQDGPWNLPHSLSAQGTNNGGYMSATTEYFAERDDNPPDWTIAQTLYNIDSSKDLSIGTVQGSILLPPEGQHQSAAVSPEISKAKRTLDAAGIDGNHRRQQQQPEQGVSSHTQCRTTQAEGKTVLRHVDGADHKPSITRTNLRYRYICVGLENWQPPVDPVFWPHPWCHKGEQKPTGRWGPYR